MNNELKAGLESLRRKHDECEDCWYSCPKSEEGCCNENSGDDCTCRAEQANETIDRLLALLNTRTEQMSDNSAHVLSELKKWIEEKSLLDVNENYIEALLDVSDKISQLEGK